MTGHQTSEQYGSSTSLCDYIVKEQLRNLQPIIVVDFGAGGGKNGALVREVLNGNCTLIAVEGLDKSARMLASGGVYDKVYTALLQQWLDSDTGRYSFALFGDVIEHLSPREVHAIIHKCLSKFEYIVVVCPLHDIYQDEAYGNPLEVHKTYITTGFFSRYKPVETHIIEGHDYTIMNVLIDTRRKDPPVYRQVMGTLFHILMLGLQPLGLARPCVRLLKRAVGRYKWLIRG